ncbi:MAG: hypothetical protein ACLTSX_12900 [Collinsella sp.]
MSAGTAGGTPMASWATTFPISAQAAVLADVHGCPYEPPRLQKPPFSHEEALRMIREGECGAFNPLILECLTAVAGDLEKRLNHGITGREISIDSLHLSEATLDNGDAEASSRTLELLDYERMKYHFFASMSNEVQIRVHRRAADDRAVRLERPQSSICPKSSWILYNDEAFCATFGKENLELSLSSARHHH